MRDALIPCVPLERGGVVGPVWTAVAPHQAPHLWLLQPLHLLTLPMAERLLIHEGELLLKSQPMDGRPTPQDFLVGA